MKNPRAAIAFGVVLAAVLPASVSATAPPGASQTSAFTLIGASAGALVLLTLTLVFTP